VTFVGHTHPVAVNGLLCSARAEEAVSGRIFPTRSWCAGPCRAFVPYSDPGIPLARTVWRVLQEYMGRYGRPPKTVYIQNHGLIALAGHPLEVENITAMAVKVARIVLGTYALGGPRFLSARDVERIDTRPDEDRRRAKLLGQSDPAEAAVMIVGAGLVLPGALIRGGHAGRYDRGRPYVWLSSGSIASWSTSIHWRPGIDSEHQPRRPQGVITIAWLSSHITKPSGHLERAHPPGWARHQRGKSCARQPSRAGRCASRSCPPRSGARVS